MESPNARATEDNATAALGALSEPGRRESTVSVQSTAVRDSLDEGDLRVVTPKKKSQSRQSSDGPKNVSGDEPIREE
eukprot:9498736-Pyramimonas_sp.AAC.1